MNIAFVIPTRNRADLAKNALLSLVAQSGGAPVTVIVSDNSTDEEQSRRVRSCCGNVPGVEYMRPPSPLPMSQHWQWVYTQTCHRAFSHLGFLTDRMVFVPGAIARICNAVAAYPDDVISYNHDRIYDVTRPVRVERYEYSDRIFKLEATRLLQAAAHSRIHPCFPRMLNCVAPMNLLAELQQRYGTVFASTSPDFCFCFRCLGYVDCIVYLDRSLLVHYAIARSNGASVSRGVVTPDHKDFLQNLGRTTLCELAPIPSIRTVHNAIMHEYCFVKKESQNNRFPEIDLSNYFAVLREEIRALEDENLRDEMTRVLNQSMGAVPSNATVARRAGSSSYDWHRFVSPRRMIAGALRRSVTPTTTPMWLMLWDWFGIPAPNERSLAFSSTDEALDFVRRHQKRPSRTLPAHLAGLVE